jgi:iron complex transport system substrate-binding protein
MTPYSIATYTMYGVDAEERLVAAAYLGVRSEGAQEVMTQIDPGFPDRVNNDIGQQQLNPELVVEQGTDLIIGAARSDWIDVVSELGVPLILLDVETPERLQDALGTVGAVMGPHSQAQAAAWIDYYNEVFETVIENAPEGEPKRVLFTGTEALRVASGAMYQSYIIEAAGGASVTEELTGYWNDVNLEQVLVWNPAVIIVPPYGGATTEAITDSQEWSVIEAADEGEVYQLPRLVAPWDTPIPESVLGVIWMAETLYPEQFDFDCAAEVEYFYTTFYEYDIPAEEVERLCSR